MLMMHVYKALFARTAGPSDQIYSSCKMRELCVWLCYVVCGMCVCVASMLYVAPLWQVFPPFVISLKRV